MTSCAIWASSMIVRARHSRQPRTHWERGRRVASDGWINVKTKLPRPNIDVWAWVKFENGNAYGTETWLETKEQLGGRSKAYGAWALGSARNYEVTHWM